MLIPNMAHRVSLDSGYEVRAIIEEQCYVIVVNDDEYFLAWIYDNLSIGELIERARIVASFYE